MGHNIYDDRYTSPDREKEPTKPVMDVDIIIVPRENKGVVQNEGFKLCKPGDNSTQ